MSKTTKKKAPKAKAKAKASKLPLTVTIRMDAKRRQKLRDYSEDNGISENAIIQQLVDRYLDRLDLGPRVDAIEERLSTVEGALRVAGALAGSVLATPSGAAVDPDAEPDDVDPDDADDDIDEDDDDGEPEEPSDTALDDDEDEDVEDDDEDDIDEDGPPSLLDKQGR